MENVQNTFSFADILLLPDYSEVLPVNTNVTTKITDRIRLNIPIISAAMDTVTEEKMAISMAQLGGIGVIHKNLSISDQAKKVSMVKKHASWIVDKPIVIYPDTIISEVLELIAIHNHSGMPVIDRETGKLCGIVTNRDLRFIKDISKKVSEIMTTNPITVKEGVTRDEALFLLHKNRIERLIVVNHKHECVGLITVRDIENYIKYPDACKDERGRLIVAAAVGTNDFERIQALIENDVDLIVLDTAHGHSQSVIENVRQIKSRYSVDLVAGNVVTSSAAFALISVGVDCIKVGVGPGSICTTRIIAGVGMPQFSAILEVSKACKSEGKTLIADGGIQYSGDIAKAIAAGADAVMIGSLLAGTDESPGEQIVYQGISYKYYRGMGSIPAMQQGSANRYFQDKNMKLVPEGVESMVPYKGDLSEVLLQLVGGLKASMGYTGNKDISNMQKNCKFVRITNAGMRESHAHDVLITKEAPNYSKVDKY